jgi:hypothetical protein
LFPIEDNSRCKSTPPPPLSKVASSSRHLSAERKSFTEEDFRQLLHEKSSKEINHPSRSLSTTNEETASSFSGWDDIPASPIPSIKSNRVNTQPQEVMKPTQPPPPPIIDCYYPRRPCDLSFTVNMTTTEDDSSSRTDTKSTVIHSPASTIATITSPPQPTPVNVVKPIITLSQTPPLPSQQHSQHHQKLSALKYHHATFDLARKLVAETSESALSDISIERQHDTWTQNTAYQSKHPHRMRLSSSYNNLHDLVQMHDLSK